MFTQVHRNPLLLIFLVLVTPPILFGQTRGSAKAPDRGLYVDSKGTGHPWEINDAHALVWDGDAYIPVGGMFCFAYLSSGQTDQNWKKDIAGLDLLKKNRINDLYINPVSSSTKIPTAAWQRVIDYLDEDNF